MRGQWWLVLALLVRELRGAAGTEGRPPLPVCSKPWAELLSSLARSGAIRSDRVLRAMLSVDRRFFCCQDGGCNPHADYPMDIGYGATITEPWVHAVCLEVLASRLQPGAAALDIGSGSGYMSAAMASMIGPGGGGRVEAVEHVAALCAQSTESIERAAPKGVAGMVRVSARDAMTALDGGGFSEQFDAIHIGACVARGAVPESVLASLKRGGRLVYTEGGASGVSFRGLLLGAQELKYIDRGIDGVLAPPMPVGVSLRMVPLVPLSDQARRRGMADGGAGMSALGGLRFRLTPLFMREARLKRRLRGLAMPRV